MRDCLLDEVIEGEKSLFNLFIDNPCSFLVKKRANVL